MRRLVLLVLLFALSGCSLLERAFQLLGARARSVGSGARTGGDA